MRTSGIHPDRLCFSSEEKPGRKPSEFVNMVKEQIEGFPFRPLLLPRRVSQRPVFHG